jgi:hypothetical protein
MTTTRSSVRQEDGASDRRWVLVTDDGTVNTIGRARDPSSEELEQLEQALVGQGLGGWLATQSHSFHRAPPEPTFVAVRRLGAIGKSFEETVQAAHRRHRR